MPVKVTDAAKNEVIELMKGSGFKNPALRINMNGFGWGGPRLGLVLDELEENEEHVLKVNDVNVIYDGRIKNYIDLKNGLTIDFRKDRWSSGFVILGGSSC